MGGEKGGEALSRRSRAWAGRAGEEKSLKTWEVE